MPAFFAWLPAFFAQKHAKNAGKTPLLKELGAVKTHFPATSQPEGHLLIFKNNNL